MLRYRNTRCYAVTVRMTKYQHGLLAKLAEKYSDGNKSAFLRTLIQEDWEQEKTTSE